MSRSELLLLFLSFIPIFNCNLLDFSTKSIPINHMKDNTILEQSNEDNIERHRNMSHLQLSNPTNDTHRTNNVRQNDYSHIKNSLKVNELRTLKPSTNKLMSSHLSKSDFKDSKYKVTPITFKSSSQTQSLDNTKQLNDNIKFLPNLLQSAMSNIHHISTLEPKLIQKRSVHYTVSHVKRAGDHTVSHLDRFCRHLCTQCEAHFGLRYSSICWLDCKTAGPVREACISLLVGVNEERDK